MPIVFEPDEWVAGPAGDVAWGTDVLDDETVVLSGMRSVRFAATTPVSDPYVEWKSAAEIEEGRWYTGESVWRADSVTAGNTLTGAVRWYDRTDTYLSSSDFSAADELAAIDTWYAARGSVQAPANARFARMRITKNNTAFNAWLDFADLFPAVLVGRYGLTTNHSIDHDTYTAIEFADIDEEVGMSLDTGTGTVTIEEPGLYFIAASVAVVDLANGSSVQIAANLNGSIAIPPLQDKHNNSGGDQTTLAAVSTAYKCVAGDTVQIYVWHDHGSARDIAPGYPFPLTYLTIFKAD